MSKGLTYQKSGVNISEADRFIKGILPHVESTRRSGVVGSIGLFGGFFAFPKGYKDPLIVGATDGVGTKLLVAQAQKKHDTIGIDLVAMNVNDIVTSGAEPLFFLDYYAMGALKRDAGVEIMKGIAKGCRDAGCAILGGETAEMPGLYKGGDYDLAGFCVGVVERKKIVTGAAAQNGDVVMGLHSSGLHSNGYSLARKVFSKKELAGAWGKRLLVPTRIYVKPVLALHKKGLIKGAAHITGGGFYENINRSLPKNKNVEISRGAWPVPEVFTEIQRRGKITEREMYRTFNMGIGMTLIVAKGNVDRVGRVLRQFRVPFSVIGNVVPGRNQVILQ